VVVAVGDDGSARVRFTVQYVAVETRFETTGEHAEWDSRKKPSTSLAGFKRFEAQVGHSFEAIVGPDGSVKKMIGADWPKPAAAGKRGNEREEFAAGATHDPTPAETWVGVLFSLAPPEKEVGTRDVFVMEKEPLHIHAEGVENAAGYVCSKLRIHSTDREVRVEPDKLNKDNDNDVQRRALELAKFTRKRGHAWFSRKTGCVVKAELEGHTSHAFGSSALSVTHRWSAELKNHGMVELRPDEPTKENAPDEPTR
jgi:hypothetical protein